MFSSRSLLCDNATLRLIPHWHSVCNILVIMTNFKYSETVKAVKRDTEETLTDLNLVAMKHRGAGFWVLRLVHKFFGIQGKAHMRANGIYLYGKDQCKDGE